MSPNRGYHGAVRRIFGFLTASSLVVACGATATPTRAPTQTSTSTPTSTPTPTSTSTSTSSSSVVGATPDTPVSAPLAARSASQTSTPTSPPAPTSDEERLADEIATLRHVTRKTALHVESVDEETFRKRTALPPADMSTVSTYVAFGVIRHDPRAAPPPSQRAYLGLYDFATHALLIRKGLPPSSERGVLVHELAHALEDQTFGMPDGEERDDDQALALKSLYEGDAMVVRELYAASAENADPATRLERAILVLRTNPRDKLARGLGVPEIATHEPRFKETLSAYMDGMIFVAKLYEHGGFPAIDRAFASPPESTEQILHPEKFIAGEKPISVDAPAVPSGSEKLAEGTWGELRTRLLLGRCGKTAVVDGWGWGGDRFVIARRGASELSLSWNTIWDTEGDAMRFENALKNAATSCWPSEPRGGMWIGKKDQVRRDGLRVSYTRGAF
jgi:hypothetical protein